MSKTDKNQVGSPKSWMWSWEKDGEGAVIPGGSLLGMVNPWVLLLEQKASNARLWVNSK